jgi:hypothetical protein
MRRGLPQEEAEAAEQKGGYYIVTHCVLRHPLQTDGGADARAEERDEPEKASVPGASVWPARETPASTTTEFHRLKGGESAAGSVPRPNRAPRAAPSTATLPLRALAAADARVGKHRGQNRFGRAGCSIWRFACISWSCRGC